MRYVLPLYFLGRWYWIKNSSENTIEVIEWWHFRRSEGQLGIIRTFKEEVLNQILSGLKSINEAFGTNYQLSKIYYVPSDYAEKGRYEAFLRQLMKRYHWANEFEGWVEGYVEKPN